MSLPTEAEAGGQSSRVVFFVSDGTGVTVETLGHSLLSQFETVAFRPIIIPFVGTEEKARAAVARINAEGAASGLRPIVFSSIVDEGVRAVIEGANAFLFGFFTAFLGRLEQALETTSTRTLGRAHGTRDSGSYERRIDAVNFSLATDDGLNTDRYAAAEVILVGLSRVGKTPTSLYMALQYGVFVANYPLVDADLESEELPAALVPWRKRLFGLTIDPARLVNIRSGRRPHGSYADPARIRRDIAHCERLFRRNGVSLLDSSIISVEEIAATILYEKELTPSLP
ncbi:MAG: pyruvate, water dikinase regulatory protein [Gammaproteobacteria bacterium]